jgi:hypothetical protein
VTGGLATLLDLAVDGFHRASSPNGPVPVRALAEGPAGEPLGEIVVWVKNGFLPGLEYAWVTDDEPTAMPSVTSVRLV